MTWYRTAVCRLGPGLASNCKTAPRSQERGCKDLSQLNINLQATRLGAAGALISPVGFELQPPPRAHPSYNQAGHDRWMKY